MRKSSAIFIAVDGNLYVCEVGNGRIQNFTPRRGARLELMVGKPPVPRS